ncbi:MAG: peptide deformylase [Chloroflexota bacterium]|nr:peptide deformylase [Chloroflexota bacterium]
MAILPILELPDPVLRQRARKVRKIDSSVLKLADDMVQTMKDANGVGLAANQVGILKRVIVIQLPEEEEARIYINPEIIYREGEQDWYDGCLSIPGFRGLITRSVWIKFQALTEASTIVKLRADNLLSLAIEHEVDHLNGVLYIDHLKEHEKLIPITEFETMQPDEPTADEPTENMNVSSSGGHSIDPETPATLKVR